MLPRAQVPRLLASRPLQLQARRANSNTAQHQSDGPGSSLSRRETELPALVVREHSAFVRLSRFLKSPGEALTIIRAIERKYGAINEYKFTRDFEIQTQYQSTIYIVFRDQASFHRISTGADTLHVPMLQPQLSRPGGIGLDELEALLEPQELEGKENVQTFDGVMDSVLQNKQDEAENKDTEVIECKIQRSRSEYFTPGPMKPRLYQGHRGETASNFIQWGGFHTLKSIDQNTPITNEELFGSAHTDHIRMRRSIRKWCQIGGIRNPYEDTPDNFTQQNQISSSSNQPEDIPSEAVTDDIIWEPLPGYEPEDMPMPNAAEIVEELMQTAPIPHTITSTPPVPTNQASITPSPVAHTESPADMSPIQTVNESPVETTSVRTPSSDQSNKAEQLKAARSLIKQARQELKKPIDSRHLKTKKASIKDDAPSPKEVPKTTVPQPPLEQPEESSGITKRVGSFLRGLF